MRFLATTNHLISMPRVCGLVLLVAASLTVKAQDLPSLQKEQVRLSEQIKYTQRLIDHNQTAKVDATLKLSIVKRQMQQRRQMLESLQDEMAILQERQRQQSSALEMLRAQQDDLRVTYAQVLRASYRSKLMKNRWLFLLSAHSLNQVFERWRYLRQLNNGINKQINLLIQNTNRTQEAIETLDQLKREKEDLLAEKEAQISDIEKNKHRQDRLLDELVGKEKQLLDQQKKHLKEQQRLKKAIEKLIASSSTTAGGKALPMTPAMKAMSASFARNKGKLPWPVDRGMVIRPFGKHTHATLRNVTTTNNGIDVNTESNASVKAVFAGTVVGQQHIPGYENMVIISHGSYYSVYSQLMAVTVVKGQKLGTGDNIGVVKNVGGRGHLHLEIWHGKELMDPEIWLLKH